MNSRSAKGQQLQKLKKTSKLCVSVKVFNTFISETCVCSYDRFYASRMSAYEVVQMAITGELCNPDFRYCTQWCIIYQCIIFYSLFMQNMSIGAILDCFL